MSGQRRAPAVPGFARHERRLDPFGEIGCAFERFADELAEAAVGQALRQRIDRLAKLRDRSLPRFRNLRMDHLPLVAVGFELARDSALFAFGKLALRPARIVEIDEADRVSVAIGGIDSARTAPGTVFATVERSRARGSRCGRATLNSRPAR